MKTKIITSLLPIVFFLIQSCRENNTHTSKPYRGASFELSMQTGRDTINLTDCDSLKQGHWITFTTTVIHHTLYAQSTGNTFIKKSITSDPERVKIEEGYYKDNKKQGFWKKYSPAGELLDSVEYKDGVAVGR